MWREDRAARNRGKSLAHSFRSERGALSPGGPSDGTVTAAFSETQKGRTEPSHAWISRDRETTSACCLEPLHTGAVCNIALNGWQMKRGQEGAITEALELPLSVVRTLVRKQSSFCC